MGRRLLLLALLAASCGWLNAQEGPRHGLVFEAWVRDTFFAGYQPASDTQKWSIPADANPAHGGVPVNSKALEYGTAVDLGDALRQYEINEPFMLILGFWQQDGNEKHFINLIAPVVGSAKWRELWGPITYADLLRLDRLIKDTGRPIEEVRKLVLKMKSSPPFTEAVIQMNPKIDARQRRLQCSIRFADVFRHLAPEADPSPQPQVSLWGVAFPGPVTSAPRTPRGH